MQIVLIGLEILQRAGRKLGPYLLLEILMPGGTFLALLLFLYRRNRLPAGTNEPQTASTLPLVLGRIAEQGAGSCRQSASSFLKENHGH
jgi:hypothetical protein